MNRYLPSILTGILIAFIISGCGSLTGYGKIRVSSSNEKSVTIGELKKNWQDYNVSYSGSTLIDARGVIFDPKSNNKQIKGDGWKGVETEESFSELFKWFCLDPRSTPKLYHVLGPDNDLFGFLYTFRHDVSLKSTDENTLYINDMSSSISRSEYSSF